MDDDFWEKEGTTLYNEHVSPAADKLADFDSHSMTDMGIHARYLIEDGIADCLTCSEPMERVLLWILERLSGIEAVQS